MHTYDFSQIFLSCDGRASARHRIPSVAAGENDPKGKSRRQGRQSRTPHFLHSVPSRNMELRRTLEHLDVYLQRLGI